MTKEEKLIQLVKIVPNMVENVSPISALANLSALMNQYMDDINWVGFYINDGKQLILGPFQGKVACTTISYNKGVLGAAYQSRKATVISDVHKIQDHIACDSASNSEIVIPIVIDQEVQYLLDIDSPTIGRFDETDKKYLEQIGQFLEKNLSL